ncbi:hypothetical protein BGZ49_000171, partial [Haplosporangium sp. Z 27]
ALLSATKPPRVYGRDSTVDDNWTPLPRPPRVVPVDAPNESWPYKYNSSGMPPPPSAPSSSYSSSYSSAPVDQKPRRVYGIDAADIPQRLPPPAPSSSYGSSQYSKPLHDIHDEPEGENSRKRPVGQDSSNYPRHYVSSMASAYGSQAYGYSTPSNHNHHHSHSSDVDRPRYEYENRTWKSSQSSHSHGPSTSSSSSYAQHRPYSRPQSPVMDIKPPAWYQNYAGVLPKSQQHQDSHYYHGHGHHQHNGGHSSNGYPVTDQMEYDYDSRKAEGHHSSSKHSSKSLVSTQSVHPFDIAEHKSKSKKPKRIKNPGHDEDLIVMDDEFYSVKAKRKRANASQLSVLNAAFERSYFPSTEERLRLSKQCRMCPRTVQIWFQNKRQSVKAKSEAMEAAAAVSDGRRDSNEDGSSDGQKRSIDDEDDESDGDSGHRRPSGGSNRRSNSNTITPSEAVMSALHIQLDGRSVDYFSRKRRATIAKMEQSEQKQQQQKQKLQEQNQPQHQLREMVES